MDEHDRAGNRHPIHEPETGTVTQLLNAWRDGRTEAEENLLKEVYSELRRLAQSYLGKERWDHTLQATELINEAYLRFAKGGSRDWKDRHHFFAVAAQAMRRVLVDHARHRGYLKRGSGKKALALDQVPTLADEPSAELVKLDDALTALETVDLRKAKVVELRFFGGFTNVETAEILGCSRATVERDWRLAQAWLYEELAVGEEV